VRGQSHVFIAEEVRREGEAFMRGFDALRANLRLVDLRVNHQLVHVL